MTWGHRFLTGNVLGAINALTHQIITVTNESYIKAESVCELLDKLAALSTFQPVYEQVLG